MQDAKPAAMGNGGHREIMIADWKPHRKNSLVGFFTASLPSGLVLHDVMLHERNGARWIALPSREWKNAEGERQFSRLIEFRDRATANRFRDEVLKALDSYLGQEQQP